MSDITSELRKRIVEDGLSMERMQNRIAQLERENEKLKSSRPVTCGICKHARETNNVAFLYCRQWQLRKTAEGFCDAGRSR